jgi:putative ribosome biogenesis GTPase RsgA
MMDLETRYCDICGCRVFDAFAYYSRQCSDCFHNRMPASVVQDRWSQGDYS